MQRNLLLLAATIFATVASAYASAQGQMEVVRLKDIKWAACDPKAPQPDPCQINYFRGNPEKEPNHSYFRVPQGYTFPPHWHTNNSHLIILKGVFAVGTENDSKGTMFRSGDYAYEPAKWIHWGKCVEGECLAYFYVDGPDSYIDVKDQRP